MVVDTSVVFPHKRGFPLKRALKNLCISILNRVIQDQETGHDSTEDASVCMEIMLSHIRGDVSKVLNG